MSVENKKGIMSRYSFVTFLMFLVACFIVVRAAFVMYVERDYWQAVAARFVKENKTVHPTRGNILSVDGKLMASTLPAYWIFMDFRAGGAEKDELLMKHLDEICKGLNRILPGKSAASFKQHLLQGRRERSQHYPIYSGSVSYIQYKELKKLPVFNLSANKGGFHYKEQSNREKPFGTLADRTLGDVFRDPSLGAKNGLELAFDSILKGTPGLTTRRKVKNRYLDDVRVPAINGCDIITTLDVGMQDIAEKALVDKLKEINADVGVVVLMEVATGEVRAIVNMTKCQDGVYREIKNNAISDMMEPGSTFKTASIMVALEDGKITPTDEVDTGNGVKMMYKRAMRDHNWRKGGYQRLTVPEIMMFSSNIGVASLIDTHYANNPSKFVEGLYRLGLNEHLGLQIPGEGKPNIRHPKKSNWYKTALPWMSIGYETQVPPIHTLTFYNAIANNGTMVKPRFVKAVVRDGEIVEEYPVEVIKPSICSGTTLTQIQDMLELVVSKGLGGAAGSRQFKVAGKTGTAQISKGAGGYKSGQVCYLVSFCGYFPADDPKYSCIVAIQKPGLPASGGLMAGSVFGKIAERVYAKDLTEDLRLAADSNSIFIPSVKAGDLNETKYVLKQLKIRTDEQYEARRGNANVWGKGEIDSDKVLLSESEDRDKVVPSVLGMGAKDAVYLLESKGLKVNLQGVGKVYAQSISQGTPLRAGQTIGLKLK